MSPSPARTAAPSSPFADDVHAGLSQRLKQLPPKYFYDETGSLLFEQITRLPEYYPTRSELAILRERADEIVAPAPQGSALVELGAGASTKARLLLGTGRFSAYVPVDISRDFLAAQADALQRDLPSVAVHPLVADFTASFALPQPVQRMARIGFFPGSTIGNFDPPQACQFLRQVRQMLGAGARMIVGVDLEKDPATLHAAYNDASGTTAGFNLNLLTRLNRELGADFDLGQFAHRAHYNAMRHRIEMHLVSLRPQSVTIAGRRYSFGEGETIHTESSYKYAPRRFAALAASAGWRLETTWMDSDRLFSVHMLAPG
jgi:dimethylhistidine N-methyltransferase